MYSAAKDLQSISFIEKLEKNKENLSTYQPDFKKIDEIYSKLENSSEFPFFVLALNSFSSAILMLILSRTAISYFAEEKQNKERLNENLERTIHNLGGVKINLDGIILNYIKGNQGSLFNPSKYFITPFTIEKRENIGGCIDSEVGIGLFYEDKNVAKISFQENDCEIFVQQIQGVKGMGEYLKPIKWPRLLLDLTIALAKVSYPNEEKIIKVQAAKNNGWLYVKENLDHYRLIYDVTAKRCGIKNKDKSGNHYAKLSQLDSKILNLIKTKNF